MKPTCKEEIQNKKRAGLTLAILLLFVVTLGICSCLLVLCIKLTDEVHSLMGRVNNMSRILYSSKLYNGNSTSMESASILDFEKIQNKSNAHMGSNKETPSMTFRVKKTKRFLSGAPSLELLRSNLDSGVTAVHYVPHEYRDISGKAGTPCRGTCCSVWSGTFCANQTFLSTDPHHGVLFFKPSPWMEVQHIEEVTPLLQSQTDTSLFTVTKSGIHLLYLNILIQATKSSHDIAIYIDSDRKLDCRESLDYVRSDASNPFMYSKGKTCSISGVFFLQQSSLLSIRILTTNTAVILKPENTNFGVVLLKT
ncbi:uncharacterized protein LOC125657905 isoform X2 [Ostrea edulis]|nr:uncharacterized protein LOC125657905 isoform X2 [Ostrea edulis]XP_056004866.1 uncharacterized protein LOC125657905 isoform X2 [Ostrea edulis]